VITQEDIDYEGQRSSSQTKIASTQKGVGRALARKVGRDGRVARDFANDLSNSGFNVTTHDINYFLNRGYAAMVETPQGMGLSLNNGFYPHCTSREVSVSQSLSDAGLHPSTLAHTLATFRTFPIRVGHIYDEDGKIIGDSGPVYPDQAELCWSNFPNVEPERTTVTKRVRRIFSFSETQYAEALVRLRPTYVHIGFCDYFNSEDEFHRFIDVISRVESSVGVIPFRFYAFGPATTNVIHDDEIYSNSQILKGIYK
jgi:adenylosuccinate synthase